jgi:hypothetical protein
MNDCSRGRRACLLLLATLPLGISRWSSSSYSFDPHDPETRLAQLRRLAPEVVPPESAARIGHSYLESHADASLEAGIIRAVWPEGFAAPAEPTLLAPGELKDRLAAACREDFRHRRIVRVSNWHLALTEARLCGLIAMHV